MQETTGLATLAQGMLQNLEEHELYLYKQQEEIDTLKKQIAEQQALIQLLLGKVKKD